MARADPQPAPERLDRTGLLQGLGAYGIWGLLPLFFWLLDGVDSGEVVAMRVLWSVVLLGVLIVALRRVPLFLAAVRSRRAMTYLGISAALISANWLVYVWAVNNGRMLEASLGYYINPLVNVLLGMLILGERLRRLQWLAVLLAAVGVAQQIWQVGALPWVSLALALTFGFYGLIRKQAPVAVLPGLVVETWLLLPLASGWLLMNPGAASAQASFWSSTEALWLMAAGPITLVPLVCFNAAARNLPYATLGFLQYLAPTLVLLQAIFLFDEHFDPSKLLAFASIWAGLAIYSVDAWLTLRRNA